MFVVLGAPTSPLKHANLGIKRIDRSDAQAETGCGHRKDRWIEILAHEWDRAE